MMVMATARQRELVWEGIYDAERLLRYYGYLAERLETLDTRLTWTNLILSSGAFGVLITSSPNWIAALASISIAGISVLLVIKRYSRKSVYSAELAGPSPISRSTGSGFGVRLTCLTANTPSRNTHSFSAERSH
jgi:hypothetical protein